MLKQIILNTDKKCLYKFVYNLGIKGALSFNRFQKTNFINPIILEHEHKILYIT